MNFEQAAGLVLGAGAGFVIELVMDVTKSIFPQWVKGLVARIIVLAVSGLVVAGTMITLYQSGQVDYGLAKAETYIIFLVAWALSTRNAMGGYELRKVASRVLSRAQDSTESVDANAERMRTPVIFPRYPADESPKR